MNEVNSNKLGFAPLPPFPFGKTVWATFIIKSAQPPGKGGLAFWGVFPFLPPLNPRGSGRLGGGERVISFPLRGENTVLPQKIRGKNPGKKNVEPKRATQKGPENP
eukprot:FR735001.1.p1 GENE.FR735001.1~~FR735001.1.p1  ORF type:complete len:106 (+),score=44.13 FR735001.1:745-1062(+)